eukprot:scaffold18684_cov121-Isochrysis_galbana.AAC.7
MSGSARRNWSPLRGQEDTPSVPPGQRSGCSESCSAVHHPEHWPTEHQSVTPAGSVQSPSLQGWRA